MLGFSVLSSLLLGSALGKVISKFVVYDLGVNFYSPSVDLIPSFSKELAAQKTFDLIDFGFTILFTFAFFLFFTILWRSKSKILDIISVLFSFVFFLQVNFGAYSVLHLAAFLFVFLVLLVIVEKTNFKLADISKLGTEELLVATNGLLLGFFMLLVINQVTTTFLPLIALVSMPFIYLLLRKKFSNLLSSNLHLIFTLSVLASQDLLWLGGVGAIAALAIFSAKNRFNSANLAKYIYPCIIIFLLVYNPLYFSGYFDSVEEGFWLGWIQGLREGRILYKDIAAYHPPLIIWVLSAFQKLFGYSISNLRLALHLFQILGFIFYYFLINSILRNKLSMFVVMLITLSLTTIMVKNNVEIRLGVGLLSFIALYSFFRKENLKVAMLAGALAAVSLFISIEVGVSVVLASLISVFIFSKQKIFSALSFLSGIAIISIPIGVYLLLTSSLEPMLTQISFYAQSFSRGYLNLPVDRPVNSAFINWHIINQYVSNYTFLWELARWGILAGLLVAASKFKEEVIKNRDKLAITLGIFALILFRSALGRSDFYHLLFPLLVAIPLLFFSLEKLKNKYLVPIASFILLFIIARDIVNASFINTKLFQLQTYGKVIGEQEEILTQHQEMLIQYIKESVSLDESIFVYPWNPELYLLTDRQNISSHYVPYAFFTESYQNEMISELQSNKELTIIYNPEMKFAGLVPDSLPIIYNYILENYEEVASYGDYKIMEKKESF